MNNAKEPIPSRHSNRRPWIFITGLCLLILVALAFFVGRRPAEQNDAEFVLSGSSKTLPAAPQDGYLGSDVCRDCHEEIHEAFSRHPMGNSISLVGQETPIESYLEKDDFESGGFHYQARTIASELADQPAEIRHEESLVDQEGKPVFQQSEMIDYVVGSGSRGRSYLFQRGPLLFQSPLTWYVQKGIWDLAPGYRPADHLRFERRVDDDCLSCHAGRVNGLADRENQYELDRPFHELSIGCERCHGPGRDHVEMQLNGGEGKSQLIVNPAKLEPRRRESVCNQCHLTGRWRQPRYGKSFLDFRPGQELSEAWTVLVSGTGYDDQGRAKFTSHVEQMNNSRCFQASEGKLGCISCHDPHRKPDPQEVDAFYRVRCLNCHQQQSCSADEPLRRARDDSCIACHMGTTDVSDIAHSSQTDHRILKTISTSTSATVAAGQEWTFFDNADERLPAWERDRSGGVALYVQYTKNQDPQQLKEAKKKLLAAEAVVGNDPITLSYLGATFLAENDLDSAEKCFAATLKLTPFNEETLQQMAHVQFMKNNLSTANEYFEKLTQLDPWASARFGPYAVSLVKAGDINGAIDALEHSLSNDPTQYRLHLYLATLLESSGRRDEAAVHRRFANSLEQLVRPEQAAGMGMR